MWSREGFTIDVVALALRNSLLHPFLMIPLWLILSWTRTIVAKESELGVTIGRLWVVAAISAVLGSVLAANDYLNIQCNNNWTGPSEWNWDREIVLVTGGSSGIGQRLCQLLLQRNPKTRLVIVDIVPLSWTPPDQSRVYFHRCDLSSSHEIKTLCNKIRQQVGHPSVVVNNAGLCRGFTVCSGTYADVELTIRTNLVAPFLLVKEFLPRMIENNHGHIVNISSMSAYIPPAGVADYAATKAGLIALHEALQLELRNTRYDVQVRLSMAVLSFVQTPLFKGETRQSKFLAPLMHVDTVAEQLVETLYSGYGKTIFLPGIMRYIACFKAGPDWLWSMVRDSTKGLGVDFKGRQKIDSRTGKLLRD